MIPFRCHYQWDEDERDDWDGFIEEITHAVAGVSSAGLMILMLIVKYL